MSTAAARQPSSFPSATGARSKNIRRPCPARLKARTPLANAAAGTSAIHGARKISNRPCARIAPHSGDTKKKTWPEPRRSSSGMDVPPPTT